MRIGTKDVTNPLDVIECAIAFDSKDYSVDKRDRIIYAIVFGWPEEAMRNEFGWDEDTIKEYKRLHERYEALKHLFDTMEQVIVKN